MKGDTEHSKRAFAASFPPTPHGIPVEWYRASGVLVLVSLTVQHGFAIGNAAIQWLNWLDALLALVYGADLIGAVRQDLGWKKALSVRRFEYLLLASFAALAGFGQFLPLEAVGSLVKFLHLNSAAELTFNLVKLFLLLTLSVQLLRGTQRLFGKGVRPEMILAGSFLTLMVIGTFLLLLPNSSAKAQNPIGVVDALFTATSAVCVTGLGVRDTGTDFSLFGQTVILALFQTGGLGIITFVAFLSVFSSRALPVPQMIAFQRIVNAPAASDLKRQIVGIVVATAVIELAGAVLLFQFHTGETDPLRRLYWSVFHSVSAFCNAGFALQSDSLVAFRGNWGMVLTFIGLIILGGLGFLVIPELFGYPLTRSRLFRRFAFFRRLHAGKVAERLSTQTKLSVVVTLVLLAGGAMFFWLLEFRHLLRDRQFGESFLIVAFQSVTPRTAGFNTIPFQDLQNATLVLIMMLMVIGANPVSTGGGIKTVSFGILLLSLQAMLARRDRVEAFGRTIPARTLLAALSVFVIYVISAGVGIFLLTLFNPEMNLRDQSFEVISALSTVGLSTGITADLSPASKLVLCAAMFVGRVGPISLVLSVVQSRRAVAYEFPEEEVVVG